MWRHITSCCWLFFFSCRRNALFCIPFWFISIVRLLLQMLRVYAEMVAQIYVYLFRNGRRDLYTIMLGTFVPLTFWSRAINNPAVNGLWLEIRSSFCASIQRMWLPSIRGLSDRVDLLTLPVRLFAFSCHLVLCIWLVFFDHRIVHVSLGRWYGTSGGGGRWRRWRLECYRQSLEKWVVCGSPKPVKSVCSAFESHLISTISNPVRTVAYFGGTQPPSEILTKRRCKFL